MEQWTTNGQICFVYTQWSFFLLAKHVKVYQTLRIQVCLKKGMDYPDIPILRIGLDP